MAQNQLTIDLTLPNTWGGKRAGAGRKKSAGSHDSPHRSRPTHIARNPLHIVLRCRKEVGRLRRREIYAQANRTLIKIAGRLNFRVVHISIQHNHIHLLVEAADNAALESGLRALAISLAKRINRSLERTGKVFECRYHATALTSPRQTRNALSYVLNNWRRHREDERGLDERTMELDPFSSAARFTGWADLRHEASPADLAPLHVSSPQTWMLSKGWEKSGRPIRAWDTPGPLQ